MKIAILGSCVTRDMVQFLPKEIQLSLYFARTSFISLVADAVPIDIEKINVEHAFNRKVVLWDMTKVFWEMLEEARPDVLIVDFIDERFDLWKKDRAVVTRSNYLAQSGVEDGPLSDFQLVRRNLDSTHEQWKTACNEVIARVQNSCGNILVHRSLWAEKYYVDGQVRSFGQSDLNLAREANEWLNEYYDFFLENCPTAQEIRVEDRLCVSDYAHKWGRDFFHYGIDYYKKLAELVSSVVRK